MTLCTNCHLAHSPHATLNACVLAQAAAMTKLLKAVGQPGVCRGCTAEIIWVTHLNGKKTPYTPAGLNHFIDCPASEVFRNAP